jgi:hypothetical protein
MGQFIALGLLVFLIAGYLIYHYLGRPRASDIASLAELRQQISCTRFTIVQFYGPL